MDGAGAAKTNSTNAHAPTVRRVNLAKDAMSSSPIVLRDRSRCRPLDVDSLAIGGLPAPRPGPVAALHHTFFVNLGNDFAVAGEQRFGRAHFGAERQLALGEAVRSILLVFFPAA